MQENCHKSSARATIYLIEYDVSYDSPKLAVLSY